LFEFSKGVIAGSPRIGFCLESLLGGKYAICQETKALSWNRASVNFSAFISSLFRNFPRTLS